MAFQDHFSTQADAYARYRPTYPDALYAWLASRVPARALAWDCGTGSGQAAVALAAHFTQVIASDPSREQIA
ncbi:MAG: methylase involved in ubiquinone/menaquinone biosynthesis, partial [Proteobacteria bacterium]|nr:methylase involved in ubiquinone/menaquinone biosynthesis [Pseudomonadota bacterium]